MPSQRAFSYGEISPSLQKRVDLESYQRSAKTLRNWKVLREGGIETRPGTKLVAPVKYATLEDVVTIIRPFIFNSADGNTYALEIGHEYIRFHKNGEQIREPAITITGITKAAVGVVSYSGDDPTDGDEVYISGVYGMLEINGQWYKVANVNTGADTFELTDRDGNDVDTSGFTAYTSGGTFEVVYEVATTYHSVDLYSLSLAQINDVISITHSDYRAATLTRSADTSWALAFVFPINDWDERVGTLAGTPGTAGAKTIKYKVTAIKRDTGEETFPGTETQLTVTGITNAEPPVVSVTAHGLSDGDTVVFDNVNGMSEVNNREFTISVATPYVADPAFGIFSISVAATMVVTAIGNNYSNGDKISFTITSGMPELNAIEYGTVFASVPGVSFSVYYYGTTTPIDSSGFTAFVSGSVTRTSPNPTATNSFELKGVDSTNWGVFSGSGTPKVARTTLYVTAAADPTSTAPHVLTWDYFSTQGVVAGIEDTIREYVIYKETGGVFGFIGISLSQTFSDVGITPDTADSPLEYSEPFLDPFDYPSVCGFGKQRLWYAATANHPNRCTSSAAGDYFTFYQHAFVVSSDPTTIDVVAGTANIIRAIREVSGRMIAFGSEGEFGLGDSDGVIDANSPDAAHFTSHGSTTVQPLLINEVATYIQARGAQVRDLGFNFENNNYKGDERSIRSSHLLKGHRIIDWCYQQIPESIIWAVRDDGMLLGCTYVREEQMAAWHRHDLQGAVVESVCSIPGSEEDEVYLVVNHTIGDATYRFVERMASRFIDDVVENTFTDLSRVYDGRNTGDTQIKLTGGSAWTAGESMTAQADVSLFASRAAENVGNSLFLYDADGEVIKCVITAYTNATHVTVMPDRDVPAAMQDTYVTTWSYAQPYIDGMWPIEGAEVSVFADGYVEASANNAIFGTPLTVANGRVTLSQPYAYISAGIPITCDVETLDIDSSQVPGGGLLSQSKIVNKLYIAVEDTRGIYAGAAPPTDDDTDPLEDLQPAQGREADMSYDATTGLDTTTYDPDAIAGWNTHGRVFIRQVDPLPARILAIMPEGSTGGT